MRHINFIRFHDYKRIPTALHTPHWSKQPFSSESNNTNFTFFSFLIQFVQVIHDVFDREAIDFDPFIIFF